MRFSVPRFFFNLHDDLSVIDQEGLELASVEAAIAKAISSAREMACAEVLEGHLNLSHSIEVVDEGRTVVEIIRFSDVLSIEDT